MVFFESRQSTPTRVCITIFIDGVRYSITTSLRWRWMKCCVVIALISVLSCIRWNQPTSSRRARPLERGGISIPKTYILNINTSHLLQKQWLFTFLRDDIRSGGTRHFFFLRRVSRGHNFYSTGNRNYIIYKPCYRPSC